MKKWQNKKAKRKLLSMKQKQKLIGATSAMMMLGNLALAPISGMAQTTESSEPTSEVTLEETQDSTLDKLNSGEMLQKGAEDGANQSGESTGSESIEQDLKQSRGTTQSPEKMPTKQRALTKNVEETRPTSGEYAEGGKWEMDYTTGTLTLSGGVLESVNNRSPWFEAGVNYLEVKYIDFIASVRGGEDCSYLFYSSVSLKEIKNIEKFDTSKVKNMSYMFGACGELESIDLSSFDTTNVENMAKMFCYNMSLSEIKFGPKFTTRNVTDMSQMFSMVSAAELDISMFDTRSVEDMDDMFSYTLISRLLVGSNFVVKGDIKTPIIEYGMKINFQSEGTTIYDEYLVPRPDPDGSNELLKPADPVRKGHKFLGWSTDAAGKQLFDFNTSVSSSMTLYAQWKADNVSVSFNSNGGTSVAKKTIESGAKLAQPANPTKKGYTFGGWYTDTALTKKHNFNTAVTKNTTLYAKWNVKNFGVTFDVKGGSAVAKKTVQEGKKVAKPGNPTRKGYTFAGWFTDTGLKKAYNFNSEVLKNTTLYAKWNVKNFGVTFKANGGSAVAKKTIQEGKKVAKPTPKRTGYSFVGWYTDAKLTKTYNFNSEVKGNITLYAKWKKQQGPAIKANYYVTITSKNYKTYSNFSWKKKGETKSLHNKTYKVKVHYNHGNGSRYLSLYDKNGKWLGYVNAKAAKKASGAQGTAINHNKTVKVTKKNYQLHGNFSWKKKGTTNKWVGKKLKAKVYYNHHNGSRYYSLYDSKGKWLGYVNAKAVK